MSYLKSELHWKKGVTDYGAVRVTLKHKNKVLGYVEAYPKYTACDEERDKFFYSIGKPSQNNDQYRVETLEEGMNALQRVLL